MASSTGRIGDQETLNKAQLIPCRSLVTNCEFETDVCESALFVLTVIWFIFCFSLSDRASGSAYSCDSHQLSFVVGKRLLPRLAPF